MASRLNSKRSRFSAHYSLEALTAKSKQRLRRLSALSVAAALSGLCVLTLCQAQSPTPSPTPDREARWRQDLKFFADELAAHQADFAKLYPQPGFNRELEAMQAEIPKLTDAEIVLRLMRLVASANVGHNHVYLPIFKFGLRQLPLSLQWYSDGLAVVSATPDYTAALGTRVLRIGTMTPEQVLAAVAPYISHENDAWLRQASPGYIETLKILQQIGAVGADGRVAFTLAKPGGEPFTLAVTVGDPRVEQVSMFDALKVPATFYRKHPGSYYWHEYLADSRALYIQYNKCANDPKLPFTDFARDLFAAADAHPVERVVIDLRFNGGGNSMIIWPLMAGLKARAALRSCVYVLIGPGTFSSAQDNAIDLRSTLHATLVGEPTGEKPNGYGEVKLLTLPNSKLQIQYSTKFFHLVKDSDPSALEPDVRVSRTLDDALAGRDPVLEAALRHPAR